MRYRLGTVFRVVDAAVQPATLPLDDAAARAELRSLEDANRDLLDFADSGRRQLEGRAKAGRARLGKRKVAVSDAQLRAEVDALVARGETPTNARRRVGKDHGIPLTTMRRRTRKN